MRNHPILLDSHRLFNRAKIYAPLVLVVMPLLGRHEQTVKG